MAQAFDEKLVKLDNVSSLHNDFAHLINAFANVANRERKFEEEEAMNNRASALRKEASRYGRMYVFNHEHIEEIESMDFDAIVNNLKDEVRALAQNL
jgi:hypothetical protein